MQSLTLKPSMEQERGEKVSRHVNSDKTRFAALSEATRLCKFEYSSK
jgi:hypothetical protein